MIVTNDQWDTELVVESCPFRSHLGCCRTRYDNVTTVQGWIWPCESICVRYFYLFSLVKVVLWCQNSQRHNHRQCAHIQLRYPWMNWSQNCCIPRFQHAIGPLHSSENVPLIQDVPSNLPWCMRYGDSRPEDSAPQQRDGPPLRLPCSSWGLQRISQHHEEKRSCLSISAEVRSNWLRSIPNHSKWFASPSLSL